MIHPYIGKKFQVNQKIKEDKLCIGSISQYLGAKDGLNYFLVVVTITFSGQNKSVMREIAFDENDVYIQGATGRTMRCFTSLFEWID